MGDVCPGGVFMAGERKIVKVSVNLPDDLVRDLKAMAEERGTSVTEVLKAAIGTERYLAERITNGAKVLVEEKDKSVKQLVFVHQKAS
jgi:hypothetical protein